MVGNGWKWLEMVGKGWKWLEMVGLTADLLMTYYNLHYILPTYYLELDIVVP
jgi:hypothetical protein